MPFFRKMREFSVAFSHNHRYLNQPDIEVILVLDEDSECSTVVKFAQQYPDVNWRVFVNTEKHEWRPPCKAINVGLKMARGNRLLIVSPESLFVNNVPELVLLYAELLPDTAVCGRVNHCHLDEFATAENVFEALVVDRVRTNAKDHFYGSICVSRNRAIEIGGYDECLIKWGGDDDNFRARLRLAGANILCTSDIMMLHLNYSPKQPREKRNRAQLDALLKPKGKICRSCFPNWGTAFDTIAYSWDANQIDGKATTTSASEAKPLL